VEHVTPSKLTRIRRPPRGSAHAGCQVVSVSGSLDGFDNPTTDNCPPTEALFVCPLVREP
jgi:hypothetical protein